MLAMLTKNVFIIIICFLTLQQLLLQGRSKLIQHLVKHDNYRMLDEMFDRFKHFQNLRRKKKSGWGTKNHVG